MKQKLLSIQLFRGIAALLVVVHHTADNFKHFFNNFFYSEIFYFGKYGVDLFFVLSGFIIYYVHNNDSIKDVKKYLIKRIIRIYPLFLLISCLLLVGYILFPNLSANNTSNFISGERIFYSFLLIPSSFKPILNVSWTLVFEIYFYLLFVVYFFNKKIFLYFIFFYTILILIFNIMEVISSFPSSFYFNIHIIEFFLGMLVSYLIINKKKLYNKYIVFLGIGGFVLISYFANKHFFSQEYLIILSYGIISAIIIYSLIYIKINSDNRTINYMLLVGNASYSIYLTHFVILSILFRIYKKIHINNYISDIFIFLSLIFISVLIGVFIYLLKNLY